MRRTTGHDPLIANRDGKVAKVREPIKNTEHKRNKKESDFFFFAFGFGF